MNAIKFGLYLLAGLIASSTVARLAGEVHEVQFALWGLGLIWAYSITNFGHEVGKRIFRVDDAEMGTLRFVSAIVMGVGIVMSRGM